MPLPHTLVGQELLCRSCSRALIKQQILDILEQTHP